MAVKIKLKRMGKVRVPQYRIVVTDARTRRDGRAIEEVGKYQPKEHPSLIEVNSERVQYWLSVGAQPTEPVLSLLKITGDWQKFKGLPGAEGRVQSAPPKADKTELFNSALAEIHGEPTSEATTAKKTTAKKSSAKKTTARKAAKKAESAPAGAESGEAASAESASAESASAESASAESDANANAAGDEAGEPASES